MSNTKQGIRDLNSIGSKKHLNGRADKGQDSCSHFFDDLHDKETRLIYRKCIKCGMVE